MKNSYTPPVASEEEFITPPTAEDEEAIYEEFYKPRLAFWQKLTIYAVVWIVLIFSACFVMWNVMQQYEEAQPWYAVENYIASSGQSAFFSALTKAYGDTANEYESLYEIAGELSRKYTGKISYKKLVREYTYENPVYLLYSGDENLLKLTLRQGDETGFVGLRGYSVQSVELVASDILSFHNYALVYPTGASVKVNGKTYVPETTDRYAVFGSEDYTVCILSNLLDRPTVKVVLDGEELTPNDGEHFIYDYPEKKLRTVTVTAPEDAYVFINSRRLPSGFMTAKTGSAPDRFGNTVSIVTYTVPTVAGEYEISASLGGKKLLSAADGDSYTFASEALECSVIVPNGATLYANGTPVDASESSGNAVWRSDFEDVAGAPLANEYIFTDIYAIPEFTASLGDASLDSADDDGKTVFLMPKSEELKEAHTDKALEFMNAYLYYTTRGYSNTRENLDAVKALVASPSPLYTNLERSYIGYYYIAPQQMTVDHMEVENFIPYGDDAFTCELSYKITLKNWVGETVDENTMRIAFAKRGGAFLPVNMLLASE